MFYCLIIKNYINTEYINTMSSQTVPLLGNQYYTHINTVSGQVSKFDVTDAKILQLNSTTLNSRLALMSPNGSKLHSITGNSSSTFRTLSEGQTQFLNIQPGQLPALSVEGGVLAIPPGAKVVAAYAVDPGIQGPTSLNIGTQSILGTVPAVSSNIFHLAPVSSLLSTGLVVTSQFVPVTNSIPGSPGVPANGGGPISIPDTGSYGIVVSPNGDDMSRSGGLKVTLFYYL